MERPGPADADGMALFTAILGWQFPLRSWRQEQGMDGGEDSVDSRAWADNFARFGPQVIACCLNSAVGFGLQASLALSAPGTWCIVGSLDWGVLFGRPLALVLGPHPAGLFCLLLPLLGCGLLLGRDPMHRRGLFGGNGRAQVGVVLLPVAGLGIGVAGPVRLAAAVILVVSVICVPVW
jgi:hypothetical protein